MDVKEGNKIIAQFMGAEIHSFMIGKAPYVMAHFYSGYPFEKRVIKSNNKQIWGIESLEYHSDWNWLMPVVEKIELMGNEVIINTRSCFIGDPLVAERGETKIEGVYNTVIEFILTTKK